MSRAAQSSGGGTLILLLAGAVVVYLWWSSQQVPTAAPVALPAGAVPFVGSSIPTSPVNTGSSANTAVTLIAQPNYVQAVAPAASVWPGVTLPPPAPVTLVPVGGGGGGGNGGGNDGGSGSGGGKSVK